jgi:hypothetical protein
LFDPLAVEVRFSKIDLGRKTSLPVAVPSAYSGKRRLADPSDLETVQSVSVNRFPFRTGFPSEVFAPSGGNRFSPARCTADSNLLLLGWFSSSEFTGVDG